MSSRYTVEFERSAKKELDRLDGPIRARVLRKVAALEDDPLGLIDVEAPNGERWDYHVAHLGRIAVALIVNDQHR